MNFIRNDYCLLMFTGDDQLRPFFKEINLQGEYLYATNGHIIARVEKKYCQKSYNKVLHYPDAASLFNNHIPGESISSNVDDLFDSLMKLSLCYNPNKISCTECNGSGNYNCQCCGNETDCDNCDGTGKEDGNRLILCSENNELVHFFNRKYRVNYFDMVLKTAIITGVDNITITLEKENPANGTLFKVGNFEIILMPNL